MPGIHRTTDGDRRLSVQERKLWALGAACRERFGCPVLHRYDIGSVPGRRDAHIEFFVPSDNPGAEAAMAFLEVELAGEVSAPETDRRFGWFPGRRVTIRQFSGLPPYRDRVEGEIRALDLLERILSRGREE